MFSFNLRILFVRCIPSSWNAARTWLDAYATAYTSWRSDIFLTDLVDVNLDNPSMYANNDIILQIKSFTTWFKNPIIHKINKNKISHNPTSVPLISSYFTFCRWIESLNLWSCALYDGMSSNLKIPKLLYPNRFPMKIRLASVSSKTQWYLFKIQ